MTALTPAQLLEREAATIERIKRQRADVRRAQTLLQDLLVGDTKEIGVSLHAELAKTESALTTALNDARVRMGQARLWLQIQETEAA